MQLTLAVLTGYFAGTPEGESTVYQVAWNVQAAQWIFIEMIFIVFSVNFIRMLDFNLASLKAVGTLPSKIAILQLTVGKVRAPGRPRAPGRSPGRRRRSGRSSTPSSARSCSRS